jgi:superfamily II DNA or RNA helicase
VLTKIKSPAELGFPAHFSEWRDVQLEGIESSLRCRKRFEGLVSNTGSGKTGTYLGVAAHDDSARTVILTATLGLQDQLALGHPWP